MSNPFIKKASLKNPFYCLSCNHKYQERSGDINSNDMEDYCRFLGYCGIKCWDKLPHDLQLDMTAYAYRNGSKVKSNHKFFMENVKGFSQLGIVRPDPPP